MKPWELYEKQKRIKYSHNEVSYDWNVTVDDTEKKIYVFTQFTTSTLDWVFNFLFFFIPQVRRWYIYFTAMGWQTAFNSCKGLMLNKVMKEMNEHPDYKVECVGHSYGGASSVLVGIEIFFQTAVKPNLTTFGAPKPLVFFLTKIISRLFFDEVNQYAHRSDIVTYLPPFFGYWNIKVTRIGKFSIKGLFDPFTYHDCYGNKDYYEKNK